MTNKFVVLSTVCALVLYVAQVATYAWYGVLTSVWVALIPLPVIALLYWALKKDASHDR